MNKLLKISVFVFSMFFLFQINASNYSIDKEKRKKHIIEIHLKEKQKQYHQEIIDIIEFKAEIIIPDSLDLNHLVYMYEVCTELELPIRTVFRLINRESLFMAKVYSHKGAYGYTQLMPATFVYYSNKLNFGFNEDHNSYKNIYIGLYMLSDLYNYYDKHNNNEEYIWTLTLAAYNAGRGRVKSYGGVPPFKETINYVSYILRPHSEPKLYAQLTKN